MILHKTNDQDSIIWTLFDSKERVAVYPTRYLNFINAIRRSIDSKNQIASVIKTHCDWLENNNHFKNISVDEMLRVVSSDDIVKWINFQRNAGLEENTIRNKEVLLRGMYEYLTTKESGRMRNDIPWNARYYTKPQRRKLPKYLTTEQVVKLLFGYYHESQRVAVHFAYDTGLRLSELIRLELQELPDPKDYPDYYNYYPLTVRGSKSWDGNEFKMRDTIVSRAVLARVRKYHQTLNYQLAKNWNINDPKKPVFLNVNGEKLSKSSFYYGMKAAWKRQGGNPSDVWPHRLRHGTGYSVLRSEYGNGLQDRLLVLQDMFGHNQIKTTEIYCSIPLIVLESLNKKSGTKPRFLEAEEIYNMTYLPTYKNTSKKRS